MAQIRQSELNNHPAPCWVLHSWDAYPLVNAQVVWTLATVNHDSYTFFPAIIINNKYNTHAPTINLECPWLALNSQPLINHCHPLPRLWLAGLLPARPAHTQLRTAWRSGQGCGCWNPTVELQMHSCWAALVQQPTPWVKEIVMLVCPRWYLLTIQ